MQFIHLQKSFEVLLSVSNSFKINTVHLRGRKTSSKPWLMSPRKKQVLRNYTSLFFFFFFGKPVYIIHLGSLQLVPHQKAEIGRCQHLLLTSNYQCLTTAVVTCIKIVSSVPVRSTNCLLFCNRTGQQKEKSLLSRNRFKYSIFLAVAAYILDSIHSQTTPKPVLHQAN